VLVTHAVAANPLECWGVQALHKAGGTLAALSQVDGSGLARVQNWKAFQDVGAAGGAAVLHAVGYDRGLAAYLTECHYALQAWPDTANVACHGDPHPGNWVLTASGPTLIDLGHLALGPPGYDPAFLVTHLNLPVASRVAWLEAVGCDPQLASVVVGARAARLARGLGPDGTPRWRGWCLQQWGPALDLARWFRAAG